MFKENFEKLTNVINTEMSNLEDAFSTYRKFSQGLANLEDIKEANNKTGQAFLATNIALIAASPAGSLLIPTISKTAKNYGMNIVPESVKKEFNI